MRFLLLTLTAILTALTPLVVASMKNPFKKTPSTPIYPSPAELLANNAKLFPVLIKQLMKPMKQNSADILPHPVPYVFLQCAQKLSTYLQCQWDSSQKPLTKSEYDSLRASLSKSGTLTGEYKGSESWTLGVEKKLRLPGKTLKIDVYAAGREPVQRKVWRFADDDDEDNDGEDD